MTHVGQKQAFCFVGGFGGFARFGGGGDGALQFDIVFLERLLEPLPLSHIARGGEGAQHVAFVVAVNAAIVKHVHDAARRMANRQGIIAHETLGKHFLITGARFVWFGEIIGKVRPDELLARNAGRLRRRFVHIGDFSLRADGNERIGRGFDERARVLRGLFLRRHVARGGEHTLQFAVAVVKSRRVVGNHGFLAVAVAHREFIIGDFFIAQH